jgi:hypothetical protein
MVKERDSDLIAASRTFLSLGKINSGDSCMDFPDLASERPSALEHVPKEEMNGILITLRDLFGEKWLALNEGNPIQTLWNRRDFLATNELYALGYSCQLLLPKHSAWLKKQIVQIKAPDTNNRIGALFEITGLGVFAEKHIVVPAQSNNPGFDAEIFLSDSKKLRLSLKHHSNSTHFKNFLKESIGLEREFKFRFNKTNYLALQLIADSHQKYPTRDSWRFLSNNLSQVFASYDSHDISFFKVGDWGVFLGPLDPKDKKFHGEYKSFTFSSSAAFHDNEHKNLLDKLDAACANLAKFSYLEDETTKNLIAVHVSPQASAVLCGTWASMYLQTHEQLSGIIIYQPIVAENEERTDTGIYHVWVSAFRPEFESWLTLNNLKINVTFPVGIVASRPPVRRVVIGETVFDGLESKYTYQHGDHYFEGAPDPDGEVRGTLSKISSGVKTHLVINYPTKRMLLSPKLPPQDELLIL